MAKLFLDSALLAQGVATSQMISTVFDGVSRHTRERYAFQRRSVTVGSVRLCANVTNPTVTGNEHSSVQQANSERIRSIGEPINDRHTAPTQSDARHP